MYALPSHVFTERSPQTSLVIIGIETASDMVLIDGITLYNLKILLKPVLQSYDGGFVLKL